MESKYTLEQKYAELYAKYHKTDDQTEKIKKISTQEEAVSLTLGIKKMIEAKAKELDLPQSVVKEAFTSSAKYFIPFFYPGVSRVVWSLAHINKLKDKSSDGLLISVASAIENAKNEAKDFGLSLDFNFVDELFLEDEMTEKLFSWS